MAGGIGADKARACAKAFAAVRKKLNAFYNKEKSKAEVANQKWDKNEKKALTKFYKEIAKRYVTLRKALNSSQNQAR